MHYRDAGDQLVKKFKSVGPTETIRFDLFLVTKCTFVMVTLLQLSARDESLYWDPVKQSRFEPETVQSKAGNLRQFKSTTGTNK